MAQQNNQSNNYFTSNIRRWNREDFIWQLKPEQIQRDAKNRIFREMVQGKINYDIHGKYFLDSKFLENLIISASNELNNNIAIYNALVFYDLTYPGDQIVVSNKTRYNALIYVYQVLTDRLGKVKMTQDVGHLADIQYVLSGNRNLF